MAGEKTITSANSQFALSVAGLFSSALPLQGYAMDKAFEQEAIKSTETTMGVDGVMSAGYTPSEVKVKITLSPDSPSKDIFDQWFSAMSSAREVLFANAVLNLPSTNESYTFTRGVLSSYHGAPSGKKKLEPVEYELTFNSVQKAGL
jgi:hypothetical protein